MSSAMSSLRSTGTVRRRVIGGAALVLTSTLLLTGCGSGSRAAAADTTAPSAAAGGAGGGQFRAEFTKIQECLKAAGITLPSRPAGSLPSGVPSGAPTSLPSGAPSGFPSGRPNGATGGGGQFRELLTSPAVKAALQACDITLPTAGAGGFRPPTAAPTPAN